jgi:hypothetical protein
MWRMSLWRLVYNLFSRPRIKAFNQVAGAIYARPIAYDDISPDNHEVIYDPRIGHDIYVKGVVKSIGLYHVDVIFSDYHSEKEMSIKREDLLRQMEVDPNYVRIGEKVAVIATIKAQHTNTQYFVQVAYTTLITLTRDQMIPIPEKDYGGFV